VWVAATLALVPSAAACAAVGCSSNSHRGENQNVDENMGSIGADLQLGGIGCTADKVSYAITGPGGFNKTGTIDISQASALSFVVGGIPAGTGYTISLTTTTSCGASCAGSATFDVAAGVTSHVTIHLTCHLEAGTGSVLVNGVVNTCPVIDGVSAAPSEVAVGSSLALSSTSHDPDNGPSPLSYQWSGPGTFDNAAVPNPVFTCTATGPATITLTVSDGDPSAGCAATQSVTVQCDSTCASLNSEVPPCLRMTEVTIDNPVLDSAGNKHTGNLANIIEQAAFIRFGDTDAGVTLPASEPCLGIPYDCDADAIVSQDGGAFQQPPAPFGGTTDAELLPWYQAVYDAFLQAYVPGAGGAAPMPKGQAYVCAERWITANRPEPLTGRDSIKAVFRALPDFGGQFISGQDTTFLTNALNMAATMCGTPSVPVGHEYNAWLVPAGREREFLCAFKPDGTPVPGGCPAPNPAYQFAPPNDVNTAFLMRLVDQQAGRISKNVTELSIFVGDPTGCGGGCRR
jgi:hypothetical protein